MLDITVRFRNCCFAALLVCFGTGCVTLSEGRSETLSVTSSPSGCTVEVEGKPMGVTPCAITIPRRAPRHDEVRRGYRAYYLTLLRDGYEPQQVVIHDDYLKWRRPDPLLNLFLGPFCIVGMLVDQANGAVDQLDTKALEVYLTPEPGPRTDSGKPTAPEQ